MRDIDALITYLATHDAACPECGYSLRALHSEVCPECGLLFALEKLATESAEVKWQRIKICITVFNVVPIAISALFMWLFAIELLSRDVVASIYWANGFAVHVFLIWLFTARIHRLILKSLAWAALFNPLSISLCTYCFDLTLIDIIGRPSI